MRGMKLIASALQPAIALRPFILLVLFLASLRLCGENLFAGEDPVPVAAPRTADAARDDGPAKINDRLFSVLGKMKSPDKDDATSAADVVELGDEPDYVPPAAAAGAGGKWTVAAEEKAPPGVAPRPIRPSAREDDPESPRHSKDQDEPEAGETPEAAKPAANPKQFSPRADDPESAWRRIGMKADAHADDPRADADEGARAATPRPPVDGTELQRPRFPSGEGLDSEAAEIVGALAVEARQKHDADPNAPNVPASALVLAQKQQDTDAAEVQPSPADKQPSPADSKKAKGKEKGKNDKKEPLDPEKAYTDLIDKLTIEQPARQKAVEESRRTADELRQRYSDLRLRDNNAAMFLDLLRKNRGVGTVAGRILDMATRLPTPARVRMFDATDLPLDAPLPTGFWTTGEFTAQALTGMARIEITRGRFRPLYPDRIDVVKGVVTPYAQVVGCPPEYNFTAQGWYLADFNLGLLAQPRELPVWLGPKPSLNDLVCAAQAEGVHILGVPPPWGEGADATDVTALDRAQAPDVLLLPAINGPRHPFFGCAFGLGLRSVKGLPAEISEPEVPLRESFEEIRARGGLGVYTQLDGQRSADIRSGIIPLFRRLEESHYFGAQPEGTARLYAAVELPFDTVAGPVYDLLAFDGSEEAEKLWFNLLDHGYPISIIGASSGSLEGGRIPFGQTFVHLDGKPTAEKVLAAVKAGNSVVTFGPAAFCRIAERDMGPGSILPADGRALTLHIRAYASMSHDMQLDRIDVIRNGTVIYNHVANGGESEIHQLAVPISESSTAWYVVRVTERLARPGAVDKGGVAWTSPIFFRGPNFAPPPPAIARIKGTLRIGATPTAGTVKALIPGQPDRHAVADGNGRFQIDAPASATLIFEAPQAEAAAKRIFEHPRVQQALGALQTDRPGNLKDQAGRAALFGAWSLLLTDLEWDISLLPAQVRSAPAPRK